MTDDAKAKVTAKGGDVGYIIAPDIEHHIFISEWAKAYPNAKIIGPQGLPEKRAKQSDDRIGREPFHLVFTPETKKQARISEEFDADFEYEYVDGHVNRELVFLYKPEKVLIEADLLFNLPPTEQYSKVPQAERDNTSVTGRIFSQTQTIGEDPKWMRRLNWYVVAKDRVSYNKSLRRIDTWEFDTLIPCHGDVMEGNAKEQFRKVFVWHLEGKK